MNKIGALTCAAIGFMGFMLGQNLDHEAAYRAGAKDQFEADGWIINASDFHAEKSLDALLRCESYSQIGILNMYVDPERKTLAVKQILDNCKIDTIDDKKVKHYG